jgi:hypothetical protein
LDAIESGKADALYGNHELSYIIPEIHRCSGYSTKTHSMLTTHIERVRKNFKPFLELGDNWLVTHAGLHPQVAEKLSEDWEAEFNHKASALHWIGRYRGGPDPVGGIFWCDFNAEFEPIEGLNQIFGHSRARTYDIRSMSGKNSTNYCIDCLDTQLKFLELDI